MHRLLCTALILAARGQHSNRDVCGFTNIKCPYVCAFRQAEQSCSTPAHLATTMKKMTNVSTARVVRCFWVLWYFTWNKTITSTDYWFFVLFIGNCCTPKCSFPTPLWCGNPGMKAATTQLLGELPFELKWHGVSDEQAGVMKKHKHCEYK